MMSKRPTLFLLALLTPTPAFAYIDPNLGGQLYQALYPVIAVVVGVFAFFRQWISAITGRVVSRVRGFFGGRSK